MFILSIGRIQKLLIAILCAGYIIIPPNVQAQQPAFKWSQPPVLNPNPPPECFWGWDEISRFPDLLVADDWRCDDSRPVTDIHWWGSYQGWQGTVAPQGSDTPHSFYIAMWTDVPANADPQFPFSHPGELVWEQYVGRDMVNEEYIGCDFHPIQSPQQDACFRYEYIIPQGQWFFDGTAGTVYWISISAVYDTSPSQFAWGWTTREHNYNDDAVRMQLAQPPTVGTQFETGEPVDIDWDMSFELTTIDQPTDYDFGDAPDPTYPTLLGNNGARHKIVQGIYIGFGVDADDDGQPNAFATGDDTDGNDDEEAIAFTGAMQQGEVVTFHVRPSVAGYLNAWLDYNNDGDWADLNEHVLADVYLPNAGVLHDLPITVPITATSGYTYGRFRFNTEGGLSYAGEAQDGEVEDHRFFIAEATPDVDFGDAPEGATAYPATGIVGSFPTCINVSLSGHVQHGLGRAHFGQGPAWDAETDGDAGSCPTFAPNSYDLDECFDDGDAGLLIPPSYTIQGGAVVACDNQTGFLGEACQLATWGVDVDIYIVNNMSTTGFINVLMDWNQDGTWAGDEFCPDNPTSPIAEHVLVNFPVPVGYDGPLSGLAPPAFAIGPNSGFVWTRFTISEAAVPADWNGAGAFQDGETEDYLLQIKEPPPKFDFGDAPEGSIAYPSIGILGSFPTCMNITVAGYIQHSLGEAYFGTGPAWDSEIDGNAGLCPTIGPSSYDQDECFSDGDAGLVTPPSYTIQGGAVVSCNGQDGFLGEACQTVSWGTDIDINVVNNLTTGVFVNVLVDWDQDGSWSGVESCSGEPPTTTAEHILVNFAIPDGYSGPLSDLNPPAFVIGPNAGFVWTRFSITNAPVASDWSGEGLFEYGETEDYLLQIKQPFVPWDFGDAPDNIGAPGYPTLVANDGARHVIVTNMFLGLENDDEPDGQPDSHGLGDDNDLVYPPSNDDEDGVAFTSLINPGQPATLQVIASAAGVLNAWIDFNVNGSWADPNDQVFTDELLAAGSNALSFTVPANATIGTTFARFRFSSAAGLSFDGPASDGEVEDYLVRIEEPEVIKWSQPIEPNPDSPFPMCFWGWDEPSVFAGSQIIADDWLCDEPLPVTDIHWWGSYQGWDGNEPPANAPSSFRIGIWNDNPSPPEPFSHPGVLLWEFEVERQLTNETLVGCDFHPDFMSAPDKSFRYDVTIPEGSWFYQGPGTNVYWLSIAAAYDTPPVDYVWGWKSREHFYNGDAVRITEPVAPTVGASYTAGIPIENPTGISWDMAFTLATVAQMPDMDFGDAPDPTFPTLLINNGARHIIAPQVFLGGLIDADLDGQLSDHATGDDDDGTDDEDGVVFIKPVLPDSIVTIEVAASSTGLLDAWLDFNHDGDWDDADEQIFVNEPLVAGANNLSFHVPDNVPSCYTMTRFRFSTLGHLGTSGLALDGEVEDYETPMGLMLGDVNRDWIINSSDALIVLSCDVGFNTQNFCPMNCGDTNLDGVINSSDALLILSYDVEIPVPFPIGEPGCPVQVVEQCLGCNP